ncbi:N-acyl homoserine lactonase family protein [Amycolatopsis endophytica]|uniref:Glyoxylase-like metal-dependent hydrolase (Beta-lactamase superfamily II) n=1 Tax=Amycolatopsis endophytica TaxID=860233 RepID=A0A853BDD3_9PSEU|nr:N-acyl homoserine lactonase family protein [Amycolatopsis endophytica]NYI92754.1 glyoxylase-like metal-dependent hydrolase (beta-lactamase superfamily II) [Amycolatopsis endophytica]
MTGSDMRLYVLPSGLLHYDQSVFTYDRGCGIGVEVPSLMFLIEHPKGRVLFDTGLDPALATDPHGYWGDMADLVRPEVEAGQDIVSHLGRLGLTPDDVDYVVLSCLFRDHAGGLKYLPRATVIVQGVELQQAHWTSAWLRATYNNPYEPNDIVRMREREYVELYGEDWDLFGDGRVVALSSPCHTRGEQALVVRLPETGTVLMPAGVIPTKENFDTDVMTGRLLVDPPEAYRSARRLKKLAADEDALVLFHHDPADWKTYRQAPDHYA